MSELFDRGHLEEFMARVKTIAVVGISAKEERPSHWITQYWLEQGFKIFGVNPGLSEVLGITCVPSLADLPETPDVVEIFRRSEEVLPVVEQAAHLNPKPKLIWMQLGISNPEAKALAEAAGIPVVMDACLYAEYRRVTGK